MNLIRKKYIKLYKEIITAKVDGNWNHSGREEWKLNSWPVLLEKYGVENFKSCDLSNGLLEIIDKSIGEEGIGRIKNRLKYLTENYDIDVKEIKDKNIGNPFLRKLKVGKEIFDITCTKLNHVYYMKTLKKVFGNRYNNIFEIGGGYGGLCYEICRSFRFKRYYMVDVPEVLILAHYYLSQIFKEEKIILIKKQEDLEKIDKHKIVLLAPWIKFKANCDLFINTMSFMHMTRENIDYYMNMVEDMEIDKLYLLNREWKVGIEKLIFKDVALGYMPIESNYELVKTIEFWVGEMFKHKFYRRKK